MSNNKHFADLMKVCSVLPVFAVMPAMASALDSQLVIDSSETLKLSNMNVSGMAADTNGGAIVSAGVLSVSDAEFIGNSSKGYGGVAYLRNDDGTTSLNISGTKLSTNSASIGGALFGHTNASITLNNTDFEYFNDKTLESIDLSNWDTSGVTDMYATFEGCTSLVNAPIIPSSVTYMGSTFYGCTSLTSIEIPASVTSIEYRAFNGCSKLATITFRSTTPPTFNKTPTLPSSVTAIYVPQASVELYKSALSSYSSIIIGQ